MPARLQPARKGAMMDQERPSPFSIEDEGRSRDMAGKGAAGMDVISVRDLPAQERMTLLRHIECPDMPIQDRCDMVPEACRIEVYG